MAKIAPIIVTITLLLYSLVWYFVANSIQAEIYTLIAPVAITESQGTEIDEDIDLDNQVEVSGYPFAYHITIHPGRYAVVDNVTLGTHGELNPEEGDDSADISPAANLPVAVPHVAPDAFWFEISDSSAKIFFNFFDKNTLVQLPKSVYLSTYPSYVENVEHELYVHFFDGGASLEVNSRSKNIFNLLDFMFPSDEGDIVSYIGQNLTRIIYADSGQAMYTSREFSDETLMYSSQSNHVSLTVTDIDEYVKSLRFYTSYENARVDGGYNAKALGQIKPQLNPDEQKVLDWVLEEDERAGSSSATIDISYTGYVDIDQALQNGGVFSLDINQISYSDHLYSLATHGKVALDNPAEGMYGWMALEAGNYSRLIDFVTRLYNVVIVPQYRQDMHKELGVFLPKLSIEHIEIAKRLVPQLGRVSGDEKNIILYAHKNQGSKFFKIGKFSLQKVGRLFAKELEKLEQSRIYQ